MKKVHALAAVAAVAAAGVAQAQTSVQIYGIFDTGVERVTNVQAATGAAAATTGGTLWRMPTLTGGQFPSRIGFRGTEDLGAGLKAIFTLENGFGPDSGVLNQGGRLFGRQAFVGLSGNWGALTLGRQYTMLGGAMADVDVIGPAQYSLGSIDPYLPNARSDNSIAYKGTFAGVTVGATYSLGRDAVLAGAGAPPGTGCAGERAGDYRACKQWSAMVRYDTANWGAAVGYDRINGGAGGTSPFGPSTIAAQNTVAFTSPDLTDTRINVGGYAKFGPAKVGAGILRRTNTAFATTATSNPRSDMYYLGAAYDLTPAFVLDGQFGRYDVKDSGNDANFLILRGTYNLSKRTSVYALAGYIRNQGTQSISISSGNTATAGASQTGIMTGVKHSF
ncbi:Outer membrane protein (porin) [Noviherbaspirillum humi]|uniref:Outer membrane protein (Porin) n=1 Tax=Noviherbaspirillum humi TaxID=1688639 RepID=A0A239GFI2_9BURK|nr:porin [Noviherbaspirillum humi]SNS67899.1 Outer membrane protein (porin) [Noviherbaspirillum humi]